MQIAFNTSYFIELYAKNQIRATTPLPDAELYSPCKIIVLLNDADLRIFFSKRQILCFFTTAFLEISELFLLTFFLCKDNKNPCFQELNREVLNPNFTCISLSALFMMVESLNKVKKIYRIEKKKNHIHVSSE